MRAEGHGSGKIILCGEHAVVYGHPALATGIDRGTTVVLERAEGPTTVHSDQGVDERLEHALRVVLGGNGLRVHIASDLLMGRGMGSSAALAVALVRANAQLFGMTLSADQEHAQALAVESVFHGTPSGLDNAVAARGGMVRFVRGSDGPTITSLPSFPHPIAVFDSGRAGDTRQLVAGVRERLDALGSVLQDIGDLCADIEQQLGDVHTLGPLMTANHDLLRRLGVSDAGLDQLVLTALSCGATGAKLSGAGGGGIVIAVGPDPADIVARAKQQGVDAHLVHPIPRAR